MSTRSVYAPTKECLFARSVPQIMGEITDRELCVLVLKSITQRTSDFFSKRGVSVSGPAEALKVKWHIEQNGCRPFFFFSKC